MSLPSVPAFPFLANDLWQITTPGKVYTMTHTGNLLWLFYNGYLQLRGPHYTIAQGRVITLKFNAMPGDNLYAVYMATTYS